MICYSKEDRNVNIFFWTYFDLIKSEGTFSNVVTGHKWVINNNSWLKEKVEVVIIILIQVLLVALLAGHLTADSVQAVVELRIVSDKFKESFSHVHLTNSCRLILLLQERDNHEEQSVWGQPARIGIIEAPNLQDLLENKDEGLD